MSKPYVPYGTKRYRVERVLIYFDYDALYIASFCFLLIVLAHLKKKKEF